MWFAGEITFTSVTHLKGFFDLNFNYAVIDKMSFTRKCPKFCILTKIVILKV